MKIFEMRHEDFHPKLLDGFNRFQETKKVVKEINGNLHEENNYFIDDWSHEKKQEIIEHFNKVMNEGGSVILAAVDGKVVGFAVIEAESFGKHAAYRELSYIHVSREARGKGIGAKLFHVAKDKARNLGADKLYIGAHPATETQAFYKKMGCTLAKELNSKIYEREKLDIQLEVALK
ncbi:GNAT family N-acetyltransferase [Bacillus sp. SCS-153A]|uniref:GNAT family N-acetyltransferase n=1 Tax=Rossellomorea sedimentorum TaxID=3115294 RepID=UPI003906B33C